MEKETVLEVEFMQVWDRWAWRFTKQDESVLPRGKFSDFALNVCSGMTPIFTNNEFLYIRGISIKKDNTINICTEEEKLIIEEKVKAINEKYGKPKRWRAEEGGHYYYIEVNGKITKTKEAYISFDNEMYEFGNYFKTEEQAEKARDKAKEYLWKGEE